MKCSTCEYYVEEDWEFCPSCGSPTKRKDIFSDIFEQISKQFKEMNKLFERNIEAVDISPWFKKPKGKGFSIKIITGLGKQPEIKVHSFGGIDENKIIKDIYNQLGIEKSKSDAIVNEINKQKPIKAPKTTEEPKTDIRRINNRVIVELKLPGAKKEDIEVNELEYSVEVKAVVGDKAYFKILTKPKESNIIEKKFENEVLHLEFA